jgi:hypothetical protein
MDTLHGTLQAEDREMYQRGIASARIHLDEDEFERAWSEGRAMPLEDAIEYALTLPEA